jgi:mono/diheme cytochrome c family protein
MKKILKRVAQVVGVLVLLAVLGMVVRFYVLSPKSRPPLTMTVEASPEVIARGKYLANHVAACVGCHSPVEKDVPGEPPIESMLGGGRDFGDVPGSPVRLRPQNLTPDKETGIGGWTDGEIVRAIREGVSRDGHALFPAMPYLTYGNTLSDEDALAIVAYLRTLKPVKNNPGPTTVNFPVSMFIRAAPSPLEAAPPAAPPATDTIARGRWLLQVCSCNDCHDALDERHQKIPGKALAGGMKFTLPQGKGFVIASNITSDKATGLGAYSDEDLRRVIDEGKGKDGRNLYVMPWASYRGMTKQDKDALIVALRAAPAIANVVPRSQVK